MFESAEGDLVVQHGGPPDVREGGRLTERLQSVGDAAEQVAGSLRSRLAPDEVPLQRIMAKTRHRSPRTVMQYMKPGDAAVAEVTSLLGPPRRSH
jgi:hypothetical protein